MPALDNARHERFAHEYLIDAEAFNARVDRTAGDDACWPWKGCTDDRGYGRVQLGKPRKQRLAHRIAFGLENGFLPEAVCHKCDNPTCCNPSHLFAGTREINNRDMCAKGRHWLAADPSKAVAGERHGQAKLNAISVAQIRDDYARGGVTQRQLAKQHSVCQRTINKIVTGKGWLRNE